MRRPHTAHAGRTGSSAGRWSTIDSQLLVSSSALAEDIHKPFIRPDASRNELVWVGRFAVVGSALIALLIAGDPDSRVLGLASCAWGGFGAAFGPPVFFCLMLLSGEVNGGST